MADSDKFDLTEAMGPVALSEETQEKDARMKKRAEKRAAQDREEQRRLNRERRQKKKEAREKNKKRKRGEQVSSDEEEQAEDADGAAKKAKKINTGAKETKEEYGVWIGNLSFKTAKDAIREFFKDCGEVTRMKCRPGPNGAKNKGFAYLFFREPEAVTKAIELSEQKLDGRPLLVKDANNFERKDGVTREEVVKQKNKPCSTLFLGNLPFDADKKSLREHFKDCEGLLNIRVGTFEDSGKCKGFGYLDFDTIENATKVIRATSKHTFNGKKIRVEFGSEEAHRRGHPWEYNPERPKKGQKKGNKTQHQDQGTAEQTQQENVPQISNEDTSSGKESAPKRSKAEKPKSDKSKRVNSAIALANAPRQKASVQEFKGTKIVFGDD